MSEWRAPLPVSKGNHMPPVTGWCRLVWSASEPFLEQAKMSSGDILSVMQDIASIVYSGDQPILLHFLKVGCFFFFLFQSMKLLFGAYPHFSLWLFSLLLGLVHRDQSHEIACRIKPFFLENSQFYQYWGCRHRQNSKLVNQIIDVALEIYSGKHPTKQC